jgi:hypothetical protein
MFNRKKIKELEERIEGLDLKVSSLEYNVKILNDERYEDNFPNGTIYAKGTYRYGELTLDIYFNATRYSDREVFVFNGDYLLHEQLKNIKSKKLSNNKYLVYSTDGKYHYVVDTYKKQSIRVDKDMKVIL